jgi:putative membrane protein
MTRPKATRSSVTMLKEEVAMMGGWGWMSGWGWLGMVGVTVFWIAVLVLIVWALSRVLSAPAQRVEPDALEILKQRFARGDISQAEYEQARRTLIG